MFPSSSKKRPRSLPEALSVLALTIVAFALAVRQHFFVDAQAVNLLFWDQWDFYHPFFKGAGFWDQFSYLHAPHRQGLGALITGHLAGLSGWNSRWDAFAISFTLMASCGLALTLALRMGLRLGLNLAAIPLILLNLRQYEAFVSASNLSHGALPVFLLLCLALTCFIHKTHQRYPLQALLYFLLLFTGFGLIIAPVLPLVLLVEVLHASLGEERRALSWAGAALLALALACLAFYWDYRFSPAVAGFRFPHEQPLEYLHFAGLMLANSVGLPGQGSLELGLGLGLFAVLGLACLTAFGRLLYYGPSEDPRAVACFLLLGFTLSYCLVTAVGRVVLGPGQAAVSRYVTLVAPGLLGLYLLLNQFKRGPLRFWGTVLLTVGLAAGTLHLRSEDRANVRRFTEGKQKWKEVYLRTGDEKRAESESGFQVYPASVHERLEFLRRNRLNLFLDTPAP